MNQNSEFIYIISYILLLFLLVIIAIVIFITLSRKKIFQKEIEKKEVEIQMQKEILQAAILSQEKERERIAQDLHDEISSKLIAISLNLHLLTSKKTIESDKSDIIKNIISINQKTIENSRKIAHDLLPPVLEKFGLNAALKELTLDYNNSKEIEISYTNTIDFSTTNENQLQIFRIIQESINNSVKHGKAKNIAIVFELKNNKNSCNYTDNGIGFDAKKLAHKGLGMRNIESRIEYLNGKFQIYSEQNKGFQFQFTFEL